MEDLERLIAIEEIKALKARYCRLLDTGQWSEWGRLFVPDATMDVSDDVTPDMGAGLVKGSAEIVAQTRKLVGQAFTVHQVHVPEIELTSSTTAKGIWAMEDRVTWPDEMTSPVNIKSIHAFGYYHETYLKTDGKWRIKSVRLTRHR